MFRHTISLSLIGLLAGCPSSDVEQPSPVASGDSGEMPAGGTLAGQRAYEHVCAPCHEKGVGGAPAVGDRQAWAGRSSLWVAVLEEHAKNGYLDMPSMGGGKSGLTDEEVTAAAEYMLTLTHPEQPPD